MGVYSPARTTRRRRAPLSEYLLARGLDDVQAADFFEDSAELMAQLWDAHAFWSLVLRGGWHVGAPDDSWVDRRSTSR